jgi:hypothetical protein
LSLVHADQNRGTQGGRKREKKGKCHGRESLAIKGEERCEEAGEGAAPCARTGHDRRRNADEVGRDGMEDAPLIQTLIGQDVLESPRQGQEIRDTSSMHACTREIRYEEIL